jgi:hypothetical protein
MFIFYLNHAVPVQRQIDYSGGDGLMQSVKSFKMQFKYRIKK